jgi:biopolymer transport protein TolR
MAVNGEINVVSLIDVMMLLMVIFMIAAPMMQGGIDVNLPKVDAPSLDSKSALTVTIDRNGEIFVDKKKYSESEFNRRIKALATMNGKDGVYLQADEAVSYGRIMRVMATLTANGITNVGMVTEPADGGR